MHAPDKIAPKDDADYLRTLTKAVFQAGFSWEVIAKKWPGFEEAFDSFDPYVVALYTPEKIEGLCKDARIVKNRAKIEATVYNAQMMVAKIDTFGSFKAYLSSLGAFEDSVKELRKTFKWLGDLGAYYFLWVVSEPVPSYEAWCESRGVTPRVS